MCTCVFVCVYLYVCTCICAREWMSLQALSACEILLYTLGLHRVIISSRWTTLTIWSFAEKEGREDGKKGEGGRETSMCVYICVCVKISSNGMLVGLTCKPRNWLRVVSLCRGILKSISGLLGKPIIVHRRCTWKRERDRRLDHQQDRYS